MGDGRHSGLLTSVEPLPGGSRSETHVIAYDPYVDDAQFQTWE
jgi:hypothetical protein